MTNFRELYLIRHGETQWNNERRVQGNTDVPLSDFGVKQAERLHERIKDMEFDGVYASDLSRARQTAEIALPNAELILEKRIREIHLGDFEGVKWDELSEEQQPLLRAWFAGPFDQKVPGGESGDDLRDRVLSWMNDLPETGRFIAFSHGGTIGAALYTVTGRPNGSDWGFRLGNTSMSKITAYETWVNLEVVNDTAHLAELYQ